MATVEELSQSFELFRAPLKSFILRLTASTEDAEDLVQEAYIRAHQKIETFEGRSTLKTWVFAIASNLTIDHLRAQKRWPENVTDICKEAAMSNRAFFQEAMQIRHQSPQGKFEISEHIAFCFTCVSKSLPMEQHIVLLLKEVYDFKVKEIEQILRQSEAMVKYYLHVGRSKMVEIFDRRCSLINKEGICHQCTELNGIFNPQQNAEAERAKIKMVKASESGDKEHLFDLRMEILKNIDPFESDAAELQLHHLTHNRKVIEKYLKKK